MYDRDALIESSVVGHDGSISRPDVVGSPEPGLAPAAGILVIDWNCNVCLILRKFPYDNPALCIKYKIDNKRVSINVFSAFLEMIQIPRGASESTDDSALHTAVREFREETKCMSKNINVYSDRVTLTWKDCGVEWKYEIYIGKIDESFKFDRNRQGIMPCIINVSKTNARYKCFVDIKTLKNPWRETLIIMNIYDYYKFMVNEQLANYKEHAGVYKKCLDHILMLSYRKPKGLNVIR